MPWPISGAPCSSRQLDGHQEDSVASEDLVLWPVVHRADVVLALAARLADISAVMTDKQCHSCGQASHGEHVGLCAMCSREDVLWCCECWEAEDTSCRAAEEEAP